MSYIRHVSVGAALLAIAAASAVQAGQLDVTGDLAVISDYRFRGLSLSDRKPALQANLTVSHSGGAYGSLFASTIDEYGQDAEGDGATVELDYAVGWAFRAGGVDFDVAAAAYAYPGGRNVNYVELPLQVSRTYDAWTALAGLAYSPEQAALDQDNRYVWIGLDHQGVGLPASFSARLGREDGAFASNKIDWSLTATRPLGRFQATASYVDSNQTRPALVFSLGVTF